MFKRIATSIFAVGALAFAQAPATQASTDVPADSVEEDTPRIIEMPMVVTDYDEDLAEANGFEIRYTDDGEPYSTPVTEEAKRATLNTPYSEMEPQDEVVSSCGISLLFVGTPSTTQIQIDTGYRIFPIFGSPVQHTWHVDGVTTSGGFSEDFSGFTNPITQSWDAIRTVNVQSSQSGTAEVRAGSGTWTLSGAFCESLPNSDSW